MEHVTPKDLRGQKADAPETEGQLLIFGDSHTLIWQRQAEELGRTEGGPRQVKVFHLGPALGHNLLGATENKLGKWGLEIVTQIEAIRKTGAPIRGVMLSFGEIDVRTQVVRRALETGSSIDAQAAAVARRVTTFASAIWHSLRVPILIWEPVPTSSARSFAFNPRFPATGSEVERNYATECMSRKLREGAGASVAKGEQVYSFGVYEPLSLNYLTRRKYFEDGCHLSLRGLSVGLRELEALCLARGLDLHRFFAPDPPVAGRPVIRDIAGEIKLTPSSEDATPSALSPPDGRDFCLRTRKEPQPHAMLDIGYSARIERIEIYNMPGEDARRAQTLEVAVGNSPKRMQTVLALDEVWGADGAALTVTLDPATGPVRFIRLSIRDEEVLELERVKVLISTFRP